MIGLFGGTFDPIHFGHLRPALEVAEALELEEVRFTPGALPPHREAPSLSGDHRAAMIELAIASEPLFSLDRRELVRQQQYPDRPSYTVDTLESFRREWGEDRPMFLMTGEDAFLGLESWYRWQDILAMSNLVVMTRPGYTVPGDSSLMRALGQHEVPLDQVRPQAAGQLIFCPVTQLDISATDIRRRLSNHQSVRYLLPETVEEYLQIRASAD
ncbi:MAG: nicotinate-nucleotide adenylyltransferase [bacterium]